MGENSQLRYFNDLFILCDEDKINKVTVVKASELFRSASLSNEAVKEIMSLADVPESASHLTRKHFYTCLKLIAAYQAGIPLHALREEFPPTLVLPLPKFSWRETPPAAATSSTNSTAKHNDEHRFREWREVKSPDLIELARESKSELLLNSDQPSTDSEVETNDTITSHETRHRTGVSPGTWSTASDSPTPTNSVAERPWAKGGTMWHGMLCEEQRQLLGTEEESSDKHSSDEDAEVDLEKAYQITPEQREYYVKQFRAVQPDLNGLLSGHIARVFFEKSRIPVEELRHIWQLCDVTRDGALSLAEFTAAMHLVVMRRNNIPIPNVLPPCLMPNLLQAVINGSLTAVPSSTTAEADLLHLESDDNQTNAQTNKYPSSSDYNNKRQSQPDVNLSLNLNKPPPPPTNAATKPKAASHKIVHQFSNDITAIASPPIPTKKVSGAYTRSGSNSPPSTSVTDGAGAAGPSSSPPKNQKPGEWNASNKEWTKFTESPTSNVSSPGPKPVNFDLQRTTQAVVSDPQILHPVPLRVTPVGNTDVSAAGNDDDANRHFRKIDSLVYAAAQQLGDGQVDTTSPKQAQQQPQYYNVQQRDSLPNDLRPIQRPQPKKPPSKGILPPPPQRESAATATVTEVLSNVTDMTGSLSLKKEVPPLPPPRPHRHTRSSSLDLNKLKLGNGTAAPANSKNSSKLEPPRASPPQQPYSIDYYMDGNQNTAFADFTQFSEPSAIDQHDGGYLPPRTNNLTHNNRVSAFEIYRKPSSSQSRNSQKSTSPQQQQLATTEAPRRKSIEDQIHYDKRLDSISDNLRYARQFKTDRQNLPDVLRYLREQNVLLLSLCNDLSSELLDVQKRKLEIKAKIELSSDGNSGHGAKQVYNHHAANATGVHHHQTNV